jgi:hypothetical protein
MGVKMKNKDEIKLNEKRDNLSISDCRDKRDFRTIKAKMKKQISKLRRRNNKKIELETE